MVEASWKLFLFNFVTPLITNKNESDNSVQKYDSVIKQQAIQHGGYTDNS